jgi:hypothetical protein
MSAKILQRIKRRSFSCSDSPTGRQRAQAIERDEVRMHASHLLPLDLKSLSGPVEAFDSVSLESSAEAVVG